MKHQAPFFLLLLVATAFLSTDALAQTPDYLPIDSGTTPDSPFYFIDTVWDSFRLATAITPETRAKVAAEIGAERLAEMHAMIETDNIAAAQTAAAGASASMEQFAASFADIAPDTGALIELGKLASFNNEYADAVHALLEEKVAAGDIDAEAVAALPVAALVQSTVEAQVGYAEKKEDVIQSIALERGISAIEAGIVYSDESAELTDIAKAEVANELADTRDSVTALEAEYKALPEGEDRTTAANMLEKAKLDLQQSEHLYETGDFEHAFDNLAEAQQRIYDTDGYLKAELSDEEIGRLKTEFATFDPVQKDAEGARAFIEEWEANRDTLTEKYPDKAILLQERFEQEQKVSELAATLADAYAEQFDEITAGGASESEATRILTARFADEYRKAYGEEFVPPGFVVTGELALPTEAAPEAQAQFEEHFGDKQIAASAGGGFVIGAQYVDPVTEYKYEFTENGWRFTTPSGQAYQHSYPDGYVPPKSFEKGNEVYSYVVETPEGAAQYAYTPTGYEVTTPDGKTESFAYSPGQYKLPDGRSVNYKPTGYEIRGGGAAVNYDYNPEFKTYAAPDGTIYRPPEGADYHYTADYDRSSGKYTYVQGSDTWNYDTAAGTWSSTSGQTYKPTAPVVAPVGHETEGVFRSASGNVWNYDTAKGEWKAFNGESYKSADGEYRSGTGTVVTHLYDAYSRQYAYDGRTNEYRYETTTPQGTGTWTYNPQTNVWLSNTGDAIESTRNYVPPTDLNYPTPAPYPTPGPYQTPGLVGPPVEYQTPSYVTPSFVYQTPYYTYPSPSYVYPSPGFYQTPSYVYPTPYQYPSPGQVYPSPYYAYPSPGEYYQTPNYYQYPSPGAGYPTPAYTYPSPYYAYPSPGAGYPTPTYSYPSPNAYPTPSYTYPTPGQTYTYPTPSDIGLYSYPSPYYSTPYTYPTPGGYPTPHYYQSPTYYTYPTPSTGTYSTPVFYSYPSPTTGEYPTPTYQTPPADYPTPTYLTPSSTGYQYPSPGTVYSYPSPSSYPYPTPSAGYPTPSGYAYPTPGSSYAYPSPTYPTPAAYATPSYTYPSPSGSYAYPTPSGSSYAYPTPGTAYAYPTPYGTPATYGTPSSYAYPTPGTYSYPSPSYASPSSGYSYPTPSSGYAYPTPSSYAYPTPSEGGGYSYPSPSYGSPSYGTPDSYSSPYGTPYDYPSPYATPA